MGSPTDTWPTEPWKWTCAVHSVGWKTFGNRIRSTVTSTRSKVLGERDGGPLVEVLALQNVEGRVGRAIATGRPGDSLDQVEGLQSLHRVPDRRRPLVDHVRDGAPLYRVAGLLVLVDEDGHDLALTGRQVDAPHTLPFSWTPLRVPLGLGDASDRRQVRPVMGSPPPQTSPTSAWHIPIQPHTVR